MIDDEVEFVGALGLHDFAVVHEVVFMTVFGNLDGAVVCREIFGESC